MYYQGLHTLQTQSFSMIYDFYDEDHAKSMHTDNTMQFSYVFIYECKQGPLLYYFQKQVLLAFICWPLGPNAGDLLYLVYNNESSLCSRSQLAKGLFLRFLCLGSKWYFAQCGTQQRVLSLLQAQHSLQNKASTVLASQYYTGTGNSCYCRSKQLIWLQHSGT